MCAWQKEEREKEEEKQRGPYDLSISSVVSASVLSVCLQLLTPLSTQSLGLICVNFCVWLWARGMRVCVNRCVARLTMWKLIYTVSALTLALCVWDLCLHVLYNALFSQLLQVMPLALRVQLSWAQAFNFSDAHMPVNLTSEWPRWCQSPWAKKPHSNMYYFLTSPPNVSVNTVVGMTLNYRTNKNSSLCITCYSRQDRLKW